MRRGQQGFGILLLAAEILNVGVDNIPIVTLVLTIAQSVIFLDFIDIPFLNRGLDQVCIDANRVWYYKQWSRLVFCNFFHSDDFHLYFNMASFIWKGKALEPMFGKNYFAYLIAVFSICVSCTYVGISFLIAHVLRDASYLSTCAVGFSGVIFALKVLCMYYSPPGNVQIFMGMSVPSKYAVWAELVIIQFMAPNTSFVGHLAGIIVGLLYVNGPLRIIMDTLYHFVFNLPVIREQNRPSSYGQRPRPRYGPSYTYRSGATGYRDQPQPHNDAHGPQPDTYGRHNPYNDRGDMPRHRYDLRSTFR